MFLSRRVLSLLHFHNLPKWPTELRSSVEATCSVTPDFITETEETSLLVEVEPHMKRLRYEKSHWDDAIHLYREREQRKWSEASERIIQRVRDTSFPKEAHHLTHVHILDLHKEGVIKPHIDSIRYCGDIITGISLLSDCVMRLRHKDDKSTLVVDLYLPRRSLYVLGGPGRYDFTHEVLAEEESIFYGKRVPRGRRISIICRDLPKKENMTEEKQTEEIKLSPIPASEEMAFPLDAETYQIGKRNYRRNPYKHGASYKMYCDVGDTPDLYPEEDEADDGPSCAVTSYGKNSAMVAEGQSAVVVERETVTVPISNDDQVCMEDARITIVAGKWISKIDVPAVIHSKLIGVRGKNLRELEDVTGCRVEIPRRGQKGPVVVRSMHGLENVQRCLDQIAVIVEQGRATARPTHFTAFPCNQPHVIEAFNHFKESILTSETLPESVKDEDLFVRPSRLHLTISMLWLLEIPDSVKAKLTLDAAGEEIKKFLADSPLTAEIKGLEIMNDDPSHVDVLYAKISGERVQEIANIAYKHMVEAGLSPEVESGVSTTSQPVKLHMTLLNSRKKAEKSGKRRKTFDATELLAQFGDYSFGTIPIDKISICCLSSGEKEGYYEEISSVSL